MSNIKLVGYILVGLYFCSINMLMAGSATVCQHYRGADVTYTQDTDSGPSASVFYGEACAFKFLILKRLFIHHHGMLDRVILHW